MFHFYKWKSRAIRQEMYNKYLEKSLFKTGRNCLN